MKILYVLEHYHPYIGGAEKLFQDVAEEMTIAGHDVIVLTTLHDRSLPKLDIYNGVNIVRVDCYNRFLFTIFALFKLLSFKDKIDIVHATTYNAAFPAWAYSRIKKFKSVLTFHEVWGKLWFDLPFLSFFQRWGFYLYEQLVIQLKFDHYIAVSKSTQKALINSGIPHNKISQIYNGLDYTSFQPTPSSQQNEEFHFIFFGRLGVSKGLDLLIPALSELKANNEVIHLHLVIPKQPKRMFAHVMDLIDRYDVQDKITLHHELLRDQLYELISSSDAVVIPSYSEGFCFVAAEACALHKPVVHSGAGALSEVVSGDQITMSDLSVSALTEALKRAIDKNYDRLPYRTFRLSESSTQYQQLYDSLYNEND
jgi:glycosyltransferase involved in cell wall biosynthesis